ncbi:MAG TPA: LysR family transcriptional regulator [Archangium sp.]|uniref:LysR family transcriptional regulator n=1 Tax=Archangium sp. TaxID=1872627 RepID=UPI002E32B452|nr:LysR family transcriptional regulator [Archangium sp.]HEX5752918.1 LysR family transcriptional regulator [Archangium sp.]
MGASLDALVAMTVFARVVGAHSFSGAAARLGLSRPAVSTRVAALERRLGTEKRLICGAPAYFARRAPPATPHELAAHNCLRLKDSKWDFRLEGRTPVVPVSGTLVVDDIAVLREAALEGLGLARLPRSLVDADLREGRLRSVLEAYAPEPLVISLVYPQRKHMPQRVRVFIDFMTEHFRKVFRSPDD